MPLTGIVRGPDGQVLPGARVALSNFENDVRIENGRLMNNRVVGEATSTTTGPDGRYTFRPQEKPVTVVVADEAGFGVRSPDQLAASTDVRLVPWGRIEGVLRIGKSICAEPESQRLAEQHIVLRPSRL